MVPISKLVELKSELFAYHKSEYIIDININVNIMTLEPIVEPWALFQFLDPIHSR
jgi:hypothetical protein